MNKKPIIITDVDSVLLDWLKGFTDFLQTKGICTKHIEQHIGTTKFIETPIITNIDCILENKAIVKEFSKSPFLTNLEPFQKDAHKHIKELHEDFDFVALSCISKNKKIKRDRAKNLKNVYGDIFTEVICIGYGQSKEEYIRTLNENHEIYTFIDDKLVHINESILAGVKPILFSRGVENTTCPNDSYQTINCWKDIKNSMQTELTLREKILSNTQTPYKKRKNKP